MLEKITVVNKGNAALLIYPDEGSAAAFPASYSGSGDQQQEIEIFGNIVQIPVEHLGDVVSQMKERRDYKVAVTINEGSLFKGREEHKDRTLKMLREWQGQSLDLVTLGSQEVPLASGEVLREEAEATRIEADSDNNHSQPSADTTQAADNGTGVDPEDVPEDSSSTKAIQAPDPRDFEAVKELRRQVTWQRARRFKEEMESVQEEKTEAVEVASESALPEERAPEDHQAPKADTLPTAKPKATANAFDLLAAIKSTSPAFSESARFASDTGVTLAEFPKEAKRVSTNNDRVSKWMLDCVEAIGSSGEKLGLSTDRVESLEAVLRFNTMMFGSEKGPEARHYLKSKRELEQEEVQRLIDEAAQRDTIEARREREWAHQESLAAAAVVRDVLAMTANLSPRFASEAQASIDSYKTSLVALGHGHGLRHTETEEGTPPQDVMTTSTEIGVDASRAFRYFGVMRNGNMISSGTTAGVSTATIFEVAQKLGGDLVWSNNQINVAHPVQSRAWDLGLNPTMAQSQKINQWELAAPQKGIELDFFRVEGFSDIYVRIVQGNATSWGGITSDGKTSRFNDESTLRWVQDQYNQKHSISPAMQPG